MTERFTYGLLNILVSFFTEELLRKKSYSYGVQMLALKRQNGRKGSTGQGREIIKLIL
jgi:hypothetical protein